MSKHDDLLNRDRLIQIGIAISTVRKIRGMSQNELAEKAHVSRTHISTIEAPGMACSFSMEVFFNIADALEVAPASLLNLASFPDEILKIKKD